MNYIIKIKAFINDNKLGFDKIKSLSVSKLGMGENNVNYLAIINNQKFVFRIALREFIEKNMIKEFQTLNSLPNDIAPKAILMDKSRKYIPKYYMVQSFVNGKSLKKWSDNHLIEHAKKAAKLHSIRSDSSTFFGKNFSLYKRLTKEIKDYKKDSIWPKNDSEIEQLSIKIKSLFKEKDYLFSNLKQFSRIHSDLTIGNIFSYKGNLHYIYWEWSRFDDNAFDLAKLYYQDVKLLDWSIKLNGEREDIFLENYQKHISFKDKTLKERVHLWHIYIMFTDYVYFKWKVNNYNPKENDLSKAYYEKTCELMSKSFKKRFL
jgi:thiamine kinase-like enzyme